MKKDLYIRLLEYGDSHPNGFSYDELTGSIKFSSEEKTIIEKYFVNSWCNPRQLELGKPPLETPFLILKTFDNYKDGKNKYILSMEAKFKYIDYLELTTALKNSKIATCIAIISVIISIFTLGVSIYYSHRSLYKPIVIESTQFKTVEEIGSDIDTIIKNTSQNKSAIKSNAK